MAEPKKRGNKSKRGMRRMHDKIKSPNFIYCPNCHEAMMPHMVCKTCGKYRGKTIIQIKKEKEVTTPVEK